MSSIITGAIIEHGPQDRAQFMALLALGEYADPYGKCFPSQKTLLVYARMSESALRRAMNKLEADGWIYRVRHKRGNLQAGYHYVIDREKIGLAATPKSPKKYRGTENPAPAENPPPSTGQNERSAPVKMTGRLSSGQNDRSLNTKINKEDLSVFQQDMVRQNRSFLLDGTMIQSSSRQMSELQTIVLGKIQTSDLQ